MQAGVSRIRGTPALGHTGSRGGAGRRAARKLLSPRNDRYGYLQRGSRSAAWPPRGTASIIPGGA